jgi:16S rRNA (uracil1498-N3)-methyltransferase
VAVAAAEQCGRNRVPVIYPAVTLAQWLACPSVAAERWVLSLAPGTRPLSAVQAGTQPVLVLSGPEGGLSPAEEAAALAAGFCALTLGSRVLRAETAPLALLAALTLP